MMTPSFPNSGPDRGCVKTGTVLARAFVAYGADFPALFALAFAGALVAVVAGRVSGTVPLLPWIVLTFVAALFNAWIIRRLDRGVMARGARGFGARVAVYGLSVIVLDVAAAAALLLGGIAGALLALLVHALGSLLGLPAPALTGLSVFAFLLVPALLLVVISMGGVFVGFTSVLAGEDLAGTLRASFRLVRCHWKLVGAVTTLTYGALFLVAIVKGSVSLFYTFHRIVVAGIAPVSSSLAESVRRLLGSWWQKFPHTRAAPPLWIWLAAPLLGALPRPWALAASHVIYAVDGGDEAPVPPAAWAGARGSAAKAPDNVPESRGLRVR
jgi:hypothetical protein